MGAFRRVSSRAIQRTGRLSTTNQEKIRTTAIQEIGEVLTQEQKDAFDKLLGHGSATYNKDGQSE